MKNRFGLFLILFILATAVHTAVAFAIPASDFEHQSTKIKGKVIDEIKNAMPGVTVQVIGSTLGTVTDVNGNFTLDINNPSTARIKFSYIGYKTIIESASKVIEKKTVEMAPSQNELNDIVVTGLRTNRTLKDVPVMTKIISTKDIQDLNPPNLLNLLQYQLPGLQISYNSMSMQPELKYQGAGGGYILFLIDGERIGGEGSDHNVDFNRFNIDDIDHIEIIKGAQSTLYGSNALGGVINIVTKAANRPVNLSILSKFDTYKGKQYTLSAGCSKDRFTAYSSLTYRSQETYSVKDKIEQNNTDNNNPAKMTMPVITKIYGSEIINATQKLGYSITDKIRLKVNGTFYRNKNDIRNDEKNRQYFTDYTISSSINILPKENQNFNISYLFDHYTKTKDFFVAGFKRTDFRNKINNIRVDYNINIGNNSLGLGAEYMHEYLKHYMFRDSSYKTVGTSSFYLQDEWQVTPQLSLVGGFRADYHSKYKLHLTPKLSLMYRPCRAFTLRAGYSQGFRSPTLKELYMEYDMGGLGWFMIYGNPNLKPETSNQYSISGETTFGGFDFSLSGYLNDYRNKIVYTLKDKKSHDLLYVNADKARTLSIEAIMRYKTLKGFTFSGSYAYVNDFQKINNKNTSAVRPHSLTFSGSYTHQFKHISLTFAMNGQWQSQLTTYVMGPINGPSKGEMKKETYKPRLLCAINLNLKLPYGITLISGVDNLFNHKDSALEASLQLPQRGIVFTQTININIADMFKW